MTVFEMLVEALCAGAVNIVSVMDWAQSVCMALIDGLSVLPCSGSTLMLLYQVHSVYTLKKRLFHVCKLCFDLINLILLLAIAFLTEGIPASFVH